MPDADGQTPVANQSSPPSESSAEEFHAIKVGDVYVLVNESGTEIKRLTGATQLRLGDYNMVKVSNNLVKDIKYNAPTDFQPIPVESTCDVPPTNVVKGGSSTIMKYKCMNILLENALEDKTKVAEFNEDSRKSLLFGSDKKLNVFPLVQVGETVIALLFRPNHPFMFLTSSELVSSQSDPVFSTLINNAMAEIVIGSVTGISKSDELGIPILTVAATMKLYKTTISLNIPLYVFPIGASVSDAGSSSGLPSFVGRIGKAVGQAMSKATDTVAATSLPAVNSYISVFNSKAYTDETRKRLNASRTAFVQALQTYIKPAKDYINNLQNQGGGAANDLTEFLKTPSRELYNKLKALKLFEEPTDNPLSLQNVKLQPLTDKSPLFVTWKCYNKTVNAFDVTDLISDSTYVELRKIINIFNALYSTLKSPRVKDSEGKLTLFNADFNKDFAESYLEEYHYLAQLLPNSSGIQSFGTRLSQGFAMIPSGTAAVAMAPLAAVGTGLLGTAKGIQKAVNQGWNAAKFGQSLNVLKPPVVKPSPGTAPLAPAGGSLANAKVRKSRRAK